MDLVEAGIDLSDAESSTKADTIIAVKQTNEGAVHSKGEIYFREFETDHSCRANQGKRAKMPGNQIGISVEVRVGEGVIGR